MEYVAGETLDQPLAGRRLPMCGTLRLGLAIFAERSRNPSSRRFPAPGPDLNPANVMLTDPAT